MCHLVSHQRYYTTHQVGHKYLEDSQVYQVGWWTAWSTRRHWSSNWSWFILRDASIRQKDTSWKLPSFTRDNSWLDTLWSNPSQYFTESSLTHISAPIRQQSGEQCKPLLGIGTRGAIHHDIRATNLWTTHRGAHNPNHKMEDLFLDCQ